MVSPSSTQNRKRVYMTRYEQETVINFNAAEPEATITTRDKSVMRKLDKLTQQYPDIYKVVSETDMDKTYSLPKSCVSYRKPRRLTDEQREQARERMRKINRTINADAKLNR